MREQFEEDSSVVYSIDGGDRIVWCNNAWDEFAAANGAPQLRRDTQIGRSVFDSIPPDLQSFYKNLFRLVTLHGREAGHVYECSTPEQQRWFHMRILSDAKGLLVVNSLTVAFPHIANRFAAGAIGRARVACECAAIAAEPSTQRRNVGIGCRSSFN